MSHIKFPIDVPRAVQLVVAVLSATAAIGTQVLADSGDLVPRDWASAITSVLTAIAAVSGFLKKAEPLIDDTTP